MTEQDFRDNFMPLATLHFKSEKTAVTAGKVYWDRVKKFDAVTFKKIMSDITDAYEGKFPTPIQVERKCRSNAYIPKERDFINSGWFIDKHLFFGQCECGAGYYHYHTIYGDTKIECDRCEDIFKNFQSIDDSKRIIREAFSRIE